MLFSVLALNNMLSAKGYLLLKTYRNGRSVFIAAYLRKVAKFKFIK